MVYEWHETKREQNLAKHGVDFEDAAAIFNGVTVERSDARKDYREERYVALGRIQNDVYVVTYTWRNGSRRLISAWQGGRKEHEQYYSHVDGRNPRQT